ncbi:MAG: hypothetical protein Q8N53_17030, partial [Longimicrobiales bacterium]|nr:hypothetical protein [Longimicrobiales bacterium]
ADAVAWIKASRSRVEDLSYAEDERLDEIVEQLKDLANDFWNLTGREVGPNHPHTLEYEGADGRHVTMPVDGLDSLARLAKDSKAIAGYLGLPTPAAVVRGILCGKSPRAEVGWIKMIPQRAWSPTGPLDRQDMVVTLVAPMSRREAKKLVEAISEAWDRARATPRPPGRITAGDQALYDIVAKLGGETRKRQPHGFWPRARDLWRAAGHKNGTANALAKKWERLQSKLPDGGHHAEET